MFKLNDSATPVSIGSGIAGQFNASLQYRNNMSATRDYKNISIMHLMQEYINRAARLDELMSSGFSMAAGYDVPELIEALDATRDRFIDWSSERNSFGRSQCRNLCAEFQILLESVDNIARRYNMELDARKTPLYDIVTGCDCIYYKKDCDGPGDFGPGGDTMQDCLGS